MVFNLIISFKVDLLSDLDGFVCYTKRAEARRLYIYDQLDIQLVNHPLLVSADVFSRA